MVSLWCNGQGHDPVNSQNPTRNNCDHHNYDNISNSNDNNNYDTISNSNDNNNYDNISNSSNDDNDNNDNNNNSTGIVMAKGLKKRIK